METVKSIPEARLLLASLRSVGYSEEVAIADLLDNCISAGASEIDVNFDWDNQRITIVDNGEGMDQDGLYENMRIGSSDPDKQREATDLGRFGMGMKTAAFSLGKRLCVLSKRDNRISNATWDLDKIPEIGWQLIVMPNKQLSVFANMLDSSNGTVVVIEKLDRIIDESDRAKAKRHFYRVIEKVQKHIGLVFHRFMEEDDLEIRINGNSVSPWNPFALDNPATQELAEEYVWSDDTETEVLIQPYVLPHKTKFPSEQDYQKAGGPKGWNYHQGIYVYRNRRLILFGTWFDYVKKEPAFNLARIRLDISSDGDSDWKIDIKKSTASLPIYVRDAVDRAIEIATEVSAKVYNSRGTYSKKSVTSPTLNYIWEQRKRNGKYSFHINKKHKLLQDLRAQLDDEGKQTLNAYLALVENFAPFMQSGLLDTIQEPDSSVNTQEEAIEMEEVKNYIELFKKSGFTTSEIRETILEMSSFRHLKQRIIKLLEE